VVETGKILGLLGWAIAITGLLFLIVLPLTPFLGSDVAFWGGMIIMIVGLLIRQTGKGLASES
jgi:hypothetical protein